MARVNYEQEFYERRRTIRLDAAARVAGPTFKATRIAGCLGFLWNATQAEMQLEVTYEEAVAYSYDVTDDEGPKYVEGLVCGKFLKPTDNVTYIVKGNVKQIDGQTERLKNARGGQKKFHRWQQIRSEFLAKYPDEQRDVERDRQRDVERDVERDVNVTTPVTPTNSIQFNSIQNNSTQETSSLSPPSGDEASETQKTTKSKRDRIVTWADDDDLAQVFANLTACSRYAAIFDREKDRKGIYEHMSRYSLTVQEVEQITFELKTWADGGPQIKSPRGVLATFVRNHAERKNSNGGGRRGRRPDARTCEQHMPIPETHADEVA